MQLFKVRILSNTSPLISGITSNLQIMKYIKYKIIKTLYLKALQKKFKTLL